ncbi:MAG: cytochrome C oxidase subunit IV family protein [Myxococcota bacterium]
MSEKVAVSESEAASVREHLRVYWMVFGALAGLTIVTVAVWTIELPTAHAISIAMVVATVKATLVAGFFMHLVSEKKVILWLLLLCAAFLVFLFVLPLETEITNGPLWGQLTNP